MSIATCGIEKVDFRCEPFFEAGNGYRCVGTVTERSTRGCLFRQCSYRQPVTEFRTERHSSYPEIFPKVTSQAEYSALPFERKLAVTYVLTVAREYHTDRKSRLWHEVEIDVFDRYNAATDLEQMEVMRDEDVDLEYYAVLFDFPFYRPVCHLHGSRKRPGLHGRAANEDPFVFQLLHALIREVDVCFGLSLLFAQLLETRKKDTVQPLVHQIQKTLEAATAAALTPYKRMEAVLRGFIQEWQDSGRESDTVKRLMATLHEQLKPAEVHTVADGLKALGFRKKQSTFGPLNGSH
jgi:hypothetical protein